MDKISIKIEIEEIERHLELLFHLVTTKKITDAEYDKLSAYPFRRKSFLNNELQKIQ